MRIRLALAITALVILSCAMPVAQELPMQSVATPTKIALAIRQNTQIANAIANANVTALRSLHVRERAGEHERVVGYLWHGDQVELTGSCSDGWAQIVWDDGLAWVNAAYLSQNKCTKETK